MTDTPDTVTTEQEIEYLQLWAAKNKCYFEEEGEVGFGRECVGIARDGHYIDLLVYNSDWTPSELSAPWNLVCSPPEVTDAYHKHDCLAILGRGPDKIHQLYLWVKNLEANNIVVKLTNRKPNNVIELAFHGLTQAYLAVDE